MKENKSVILITSIIIVILGIILGIIFLKKDNLETDAIRFKKEYESLNNTTRESDGHKYNNVNIDEDNPIVYVNAKEASDIIKNKSGVIYIGANWCPWCRNAISVLFESAKANNVDKIYYVDLTEYRNIWEIKNRELVKTQKEKDGYYDLLNSLDKVLGENTYKLKDEDGKEYDTNEKRIYMPTVLGVKSGKITETHVGTVKINEGQDKYSDLTDEQRNELLDIYNNLVKSTKSDGKCGLDSACD